MIIGNGLIANAFRKSIFNREVIVFASGPSDSKNTAQNEFEREFNLLQNTIEKSKDKLLIYFSTASVLDSSLKNSDYCQHKLKIEKHIEEHAQHYLIARVSNVVGAGGNSKTIFNFFKEKIIHNEQFDLWRNAERNLIDINDLTRIIEYLVNNNYQNQIILTINPISISVLELVKMMEHKLRMDAKFNLIDAGEKLNFDTSAVINEFNCFNIDFANSYYEKLLDKYIISD